ncbi:hypothetical protein [Mesorhizobium sp. RIZ17]|uniref:hypothetical protein n=1 Tax=Mesorhizobium sp. RIZ17 TaxID=3132743 RepID=UPI003DA8B59D
MNAPVIFDQNVRRAVEDEIERLIGLLDVMDSDPDLEPWLAGGIEVVGKDDREGDDERELDDEREDDHAERDFPGFILGGQGI